MVSGQHRARLVSRETFSPLLFSEDCEDFFVGFFFKYLVEFAGETIQGWNCSKVSSCEIRTAQAASSGWPFVLCGLEGLGSLQ